MRLATAIGPGVSGFLNLLGGILALFPGLFEVALQREGEAPGGEVGLLELLATPYGRWSLALLAVGSLQLAAMGGLGLLASGGVHGIAALFVLALASGGIEIWGIVAKEGSIAVNLPGLLTAALLVGLGIRSRVS